VEDGQAISQEPEEEEGEDEVAGTIRTLSPLKPLRKQKRRESEGCIVVAASDAEGVTRRESEGCIVVAASDTKSERAAPRAWFPEPSLIEIRDQCLIWCRMEDLMALVLVLIVRIVVMVLVF
jgi:hypothetical protein